MIAPSRRRAAARRLVLLTLLALAAATLGALGIDYWSARHLRGARAVLQRREYDAARASLLRHLDARPSSSSSSARARRTSGSREADSRSIRAAPWSRLRTSGTDGVPGSGVSGMVIPPSHGRGICGGSLGADRGAWLAPLPDNVFRGPATAAEALVRPDNNP